MLKRTILFAFCGCLQAVAPVKAQETLSLMQCRELALTCNKEMAAAAKQTESARYMEKSYKGNFFPDLTASGTALYSNAKGSYAIPGGNLPVFLPDAEGEQPTPNGSFAYFPGIDLDYKTDDVYMGGIQLEQPIYMGGKIRAAYKMAQYGRQMSQMSESLTAAEVIQNTDRAYALVVKAKEMNTVAEAYHDVLSELKKNVESAYKHGLKPQNDVLKVQVKFNESELGMRKAENALRLATMNLCRLIGKPLDYQLQVTDDLPEVEQTLPLQTNDISARPEYAILEKQAAIAKQQVRLNRSELLPQIGIRGSYDYLNGMELNGKNAFDNGSFSVLLNVKIPIFHFGERLNKVRAAKAKLEQARLQQQDINEQMLLELTQAANNLDEAKLESEMSEHSLQQAEENRRVSRKQYEVGLETLSDHLEAQALWQQAYETRVNARFQLYLSHIAYQKAAGTLR